jgi:hypothetical protein
MTLKETMELANIEFRLDTAEKCSLRLRIHIPGFFLALFRSPHSAIFFWPNILSNYLSSHYLLDYCLNPKRLRSENLNLVIYPRYCT